MRKVLAFATALTLFATALTLLLTVGSRARTDLPVAEIEPAGSQPGPRAVAWRPPAVSG